MRLTFLMLALGMLGISSLAATAMAQKVVFKNEASSTGSIDFEFQDGKRIFIPAKINGHNTIVHLATGLPFSEIDELCSLNRALA